jgi:hypothetical protein
MPVHSGVDGVHSGVDGVHSGMDVVHSGVDGVPFVYPLRVLAANTHVAADSKCC